MPTVTWTYEYTSSLSPMGNVFGWTWKSDDGEDFSGTAHGCAANIVNLPAHSAGYRRFNMGDTLTWETAGVPAGKFVTAIAVRLKKKRGATDSANVTDFHWTIYLYRESGGSTVGSPLTVATEHWAPGASTAWLTYEGSTLCIEEAWAASTQSLWLELTADVFAPYLSGDSTTDYRFDTLEFTITYADAWVDCDAPIGGGGGSSATCDDSLPPQLWMLTSTRKAARWQDGTTRDMIQGTDATTGSAIPDWVYSTGFAVQDAPIVVKGLSVNADGPVEVRTAKTVDGTEPAQARAFEALPKEGQDSVWIPAASDFRAHKVRLEFRGANDVELRRAMVDAEPIESRGG